MHGRCAPLHKKQRQKSIVYPSIPSSISPVPHCEDSPIPKPPMLESLSSASASEEEGRDADFDEKEPHFPNQQDMDALIRSMGLTKENEELLTSRLKEWHLLDPTCKVIKYRKRHLSFASFFTVHNLILCAIAQTYLDFLTKLEQTTTPQIGACS